MNVNLPIADPDDSSKTYVFWVYFARNDEELWVADIRCSGLEGNKLFWSSED